MEACELDNLLVNFSDFGCITDLAEHCDIDRLCPHIREAQEAHLSNKIGWGLLNEILERPEDEKFKELLCGSTFEYCGKKERHFGLKRVLVYYAYALYKYSGNYVDTAYGTVYKSVEDSVPVGDEILIRIRNEYFNMANAYWKNVKKYLCANKENFKEFDPSNCVCQCGGCDNSNGLIKSRIRTVKTFKKYGNNSNNEQKCRSIHENCRCNKC